MYTLSGFRNIKKIRGEFIFKIYLELMVSLYIYRIFQNASDRNLEATFLMKTQKKLFRFQDTEKVQPINTSLLLLNLENAFDDFNEIFNIYLNNFSTS